MRVWIAIVLFLNGVSFAKPVGGNHVFNVPVGDLMPQGRQENPKAAPEDEVTVLKKYHREWNAYQKFITIYLKDHPEFILIPDAPKQVTDDLTNPDPVKTFEANVKASVANAVAAYKIKKPAPSEEQLADYESKALIAYRQQVSQLYRLAAHEIANKITFIELHKTKKEFDKSKAGKEEMGAIIEERKVFGLEATDKLYFELVKENSPIVKKKLQPIFPKDAGADLPSMKELWEMIVDARKAEQDRP